MKTKFFSLVVLAVLVFNALVVLGPSQVSASSGVVNGIQGHINGVLTCHCPDDAGTCKCAVATE